MYTVIIGSGIIGTSTAYYLSQSSKDAIHLIDSSPHLFASASGYAAGFLASDWFSQATASLGKLSFDLHRKLADENNGYERWGYCPSTATSLAETVDNGGEEEDGGQDWIAQGVSRAVAAKRIADPERDGARPVWLAKKWRPEVIDHGVGTAQCDPLELCRFLIGECRGRGVQVHQPAKAISIQRDIDGKIESVTIQSESETHDIPCTNLVLAAGPWTPKVFSTLFPTSDLDIPISSLAGHALLLKSPLWPPPNSNLTPPTENPKTQPPCHALFTTDPQAHLPYAPELFSRLPSGHIYIAGLNNANYPLPDLATDSEIDPQAIATLEETAERLLGESSFEVERKSVCWRPVTGRGTPVVGRAEKGGIEERGVWIAAGHGPWGISLSLGTGKVVAEMIEGVEVSADVSGLGL